MRLDFRFVDFEVTRMCNQVCKDWCMRGKMQNVKLSKEMVDKFFDDPIFDMPENKVRIGRVLFSGGEPTLNEDIIEYIIDKIIERGIDVGQLNMVTNGLKYSERIMEAFRRFERHKDAAYAGGKMQHVEIGFSVDGFHKPMPGDVIESYEKHGYYPSRRSHNTSKRRLLTGLSTAGRAFNYVRKKAGFYDGVLKSGIDIHTPVYLSANGNLHIGGEGSYEEMDRAGNNWGNIMETTLEDVCVREFGMDLAGLRQKIMARIYRNRICLVDKRAVQFAPEAAMGSVRESGVGQELALAR